MTVTTIATDGVLPPPIANPFVGPRAFEYGETLFGRSEELREIRDLLIAQRILLLYSPSGAGKSSLLEAALRPELESRNFRVLPTVRIGQGAPPALAGMPVRNRYVLSTLLSLERGKPASEQFEKERLVTADLSEYLAALGGTPGGDPVLFFDQFEELFTLDPTDVEQKLAFVEELGEALRNRGRWALFAMREEFVAQLDPYVDLLPTLLRTRYRLDLLTASAAIDAIREPARRAGVEISQDAAERLVDDLRSVKVQRGGATTKEPGPYVEPVQLQVVCRQLWDRPRSTMWSIELPDVLALGEIDRPLAEYYAEQVRDAAAGSQVSEREIRNWFEHTLIAPGGYRMQTIDGPDGDVGGSAIDALLRAHLVRGEDRRGATWYELAHDRLVEPVMRSNAEWREGNLSMLQQAAATWADADRRDGLLISSTDVLKDAEAWVKEHPDDVSSVDDDYLKASRRQWQQARRSRRLSYVLAGVGVLAILCLAAAVVLWRTAVGSKNRAVGFERSARWLANASTAAPDDGRMTATSWINATRVFPRSISDAPNQFGPLADSALHFLAHDPYDGGVFAFRSDGHDVVEAGADGRVSVVHLDDGSRRQLMLADDPITDMDFDQSGPRFSVIVQVGAASELQRWDVDTATLLGRVKIPAAHAVGPGVSADGQTVAVYTDDTVKDKRSAVAELIILDAQSSAVGYRSGPHVMLDARPAVAPDGERVAVVGDDLCLHVVTRLQATWSDKKIDELCNLTDFAALAFDPTGARVAVGRADGTLGILALGDGSITSVPGDGEVITDVAFLPDGSLHTLTRGGSLETWQAEAATFTNVLSARRAAPAGYVGRFTTDARRAVVWGDSGLVVFDSLTGREMTSEQLLGPREADVAAAGRVKIDWTGEAVMDDWDGRELWRTPPTMGTVRSVAVGRSFGLPGSVVVMSTDSSIVVLDAEDGTKRYELPLAPRPTLPDADRSDNDGPAIGNSAPALDQTAASGDAEVVVAATGNLFTIWDPVKENVRQPALPAGARITSIATSWDGSTVAAGLVTGARSEIWVWEGGKEPRKFAVQSEVTALELNIGLLAGTSDGKLWWWDLTTTDPPPNPLTLHVDGPVVDLDWLVASDTTDVVVATPRTVSVFDVDKSFDLTPPDPIRQIRLFAAEGDFLGVASDDSRLLMVEADGFSYAMDDAGKQIDLDQARKDAEQLRERTGMRMTPTECNDDPKLPCPAA